MCIEINCIEVPYVLSLSGKIYLMYYVSLAIKKNFHAKINHSPEKLIGIIKQFCVLLPVALNLILACLLASSSTRGKLLQNIFL